VIPVSDVGSLPADTMAPCRTALWHPGTCPIGRITTVTTHRRDVPDQLTWLSVTRRTSPPSYPDISLFFSLSLSLSLSLVQFAWLSSFLTSERPWQTCVVISQSDRLSYSTREKLNVHDITRICGWDTNCEHSDWRVARQMDS
jgi:hypothetical protein